jgi:hypothetical protein
MGERSYSSTHAYPSLPPYFQGNAPVTLCPSPRHVTDDQVYMLRSVVMERLSDEQASLSFVESLRLCHLHQFGKGKIVPVPN